MAATRTKVMTKAAMIETVAKKSKLTKKDAERAINTLFDAVKDNLKRGQKVQIIPFGSFEVRHRAARNGRNPRTGARITIKARRVPVFKAGKALKEAVR